MRPRGITSKSTSAALVDTVAFNNRLLLLRAAAARLEHVAALLAEIPGAILIVVEVIILFTGVLFRYVLQEPLLWSDELAGILFLWLSMLGAVDSQCWSDWLRRAGADKLKPSRRSS